MKFDDLIKDLHLCTIQHHQCGSCTFFDYDNCEYRLKITAELWLRNQQAEIEQLKANQLTMNEYQKLAMRTCNIDDTERKINHSLHGMVGEIGELHSLYQKLYQGHKLDEEHLKKECGDLLWFIAEYADAHGWKLDDIAQLNIDKLKNRYPQGFEAERSLHRQEGDI